MKTVIVYPRGQLKPADKKAMKEAGIIAVEADDPSKVVTVIPGSAMVTPDDLLMAALFGVTQPGYANSKEAMVAELHRRLKAKEQAANA